MKALPLLKLLLLIALAAFLQVVAAPAYAVEAQAADTAQVASSMVGTPEPGSVILLCAVGLMLMLRRRRLHA